MSTSSHLPGIRLQLSSFGAGHLHKNGSKTDRFGDDPNRSDTREQAEIWQLREENKKWKDQCKRLEFEQAASLSEINALRGQIDHFNLRWEARESLIEQLQQTILSLQSRFDDSIHLELGNLNAFSPSWARRAGDGHEPDGIRELAFKEERFGGLIKGSLSHRRTMAHRARFPPFAAFVSSRVRTMSASIIDRKHGPLRR